MTTLYRLKPAFQNLLRPLVRRLHAAGCTANQATLAACIGSALLGGALALNPGDRWLFGLLPFWMLARMALNAIDGMLAREFGQASPLGAYLNELCDVIADAALLLPFALLPGVAPDWVVLVVVLALISEFSGALGPMVGTSRRYDGPMGKSDRAFVFGALGAGVAGVVLPGSWITVTLMGVTGLLVWNTVNRVRRGLADIESPIGD